MSEHQDSRRGFLASAGAALTGAWLVSNWPAVAEAAEHARHAAAAPAAVGLRFLSVSDALDVEAIAAQILPSGATPGAREAHAAYFIDRALGTFFSDRAAVFHSDLAQFQHAFRVAHATRSSFAEASAPEQIAFLRTVDRTPFFVGMRKLTILGTLSASRYGGNFEGVGWKMIGFEDRHAFASPFGYYDRGYAGFVPYQAKDSA